MTEYMSFHKLCQGEVMIAVLVIPNNKSALQKTNSSNCTFDLILHLQKGSKNLKDKSNKNPVESLK
jgi:hypothetical protein